MSRAKKVGPLKSEQPAAAALFTTETKAAMTAITAMMMKTTQ